MEQPEATSFVVTFDRMRLLDRVIYSFNRSTNEDSVVVTMKGDFQVCTLLDHNAITREDIKGVIYHSTSCQGPASFVEVSTSIPSITGIGFVVQERNAHAVFNQL